MDTHDPLHIVLSFKISMMFLQKQSIEFLSNDLILDNKDLQHITYHLVIDSTRMYAPAVQIDSTRMYAPAVQINSTRMYAPAVQIDSTKMYAPAVQINDISTSINNPMIDKKSECEPVIFSNVGKLYENKTATYTTAVGSYSEWSNNVDLGPPLGNISPPEDEKIMDYYQALQYTLYENNLPETKDRTHKPRTNKTNDDVTIALLSSPVECMAILLDGGVKSPGNMLLVMSTTWIEKRKSEKHPGLFSLYINKAISFESGGRSFIDVYTPARLVTYFVNFFTAAVTDGQRNDGETLGECPLNEPSHILGVFRLKK